MASPFDEMIASAMHAKLAKDIRAFDEGNGVGVFLGAAAHALNASDHKKLVKAARKELRRLEKKSNGCPRRVFEWHDHCST